MENLSTDNCRAMDNYILLLVTITLESLSSIKSKVVVCIDGPERSRTYTKENSSQESVMAEELSGGQMAVGTKASSRKESNVVRECFIEKVEVGSMKAAGKMVCLTVREFNTLTMANDMKAFSKKISSTEMVSSTKMTRSFMVFGKIMSCQ